MNIGSKLRYLIEEAYITQRQLADALHISPSALNGYINQGERTGLCNFSKNSRLFSYFHRLSARSQ
ncbi:MAG: helix-turn-helix domain-containing protein [Roseburia sp.]